LILHSLEKLSSEKLSGEKLSVEQAIGDDRPIDLFTQGLTVAEFG